MNDGIEAVRYCDNCLVFEESLNLFLNQFIRLEVYIRSRLIDQDNLRPLEEGTSNAEELLLTLAQVVPVEIELVIETLALEHIL